METLKTIIQRTSDALLPNAKGQKLQSGWKEIQKECPATELYFYRYAFSNASKPDDLQKVLQEQWYRKGADEPIRIRVTLDAKYNLSKPCKSETEAALIIRLNNRQDYREGTSLILTESGKVLFEKEVLLKGIDVKSDKVRRTRIVPTLKNGISFEKGQFKVGSLCVFVPNPEEISNRILEGRNAVDVLTV